MRVEFKPFGLSIIFDENYTESSLFRGLIMNDFEKKIREVTGSPLKASDITTLQVNIGLQCNSQCRHCHLSASPERTEMMKWSTMQLVLAKTHEIRPTLIDITGGAPELNPHLRMFLKTLRENGYNFQVRTNLTVLLESRIEMIDFYRDNGVKLVASLPCYLREEVDSVRGDGAFKKSIEVLKLLNDVGYGLDPSLELDLVFNPEGAFLPPKQSSLERDYKSNLQSKFGIVFNKLITITNMPIGRFLKLLHQQNSYEKYFQMLKEAFNPETLEGLMCRHQIDVAWDGRIYDCDFNLGLGFPIGGEVPLYIDNLDFFSLSNREILTGDHCFGCTAGYGSSCGGALVD